MDEMSVIEWLGALCVAAGVIGLMGAAAWRLDEKERTPAQQQAVEDQRRATYPYCREGHMDCVAFCECTRSRGSYRAFRRARERVYVSGVEPSEAARTRGNLQTFQIGESIDG